MALKGIIKRLALCLLLSGMCFPVSAQKSKDSEELGKALDYFTSAKYHEALLIFQRLDKEYNLPSLHMSGLSIISPQRKASST